MHPVSSSTMGWYTELIRFASITASMLIRVSDEAGDFTAAPPRSGRRRGVLGVQLQQSVGYAALVIRSGFSSGSRVAGVHRWRCSASSNSSTCSNPIRPGREERLGDLDVGREPNAGMVIIERDPFVCLYHYVGVAFEELHEAAAAAAACPSRPSPCCCEAISPTARRAPTVRRLLSPGCKRSNVSFIASLRTSNESRQHPFCKQSRRRSAAGWLSPTTDEQGSLHETW